MNSCIKIFFIVLLSLILAANPISGRKDPNAYWGEKMKEQDLPEAIKDLIMNERSFEKLEQEKVIKDFIKDFEPIPNISVYHDDVNPKQVMKSSNADCNLHDDHVKLAPKKLAVVEDFEPIPNISVYNN